MNEDKAQSQLWVQRFLFSAPLYAPNEISFAGATTLFVDHFRIEGHCPYCKSTSFFTRCRGTKGIASVQTLLDSQELCQLEVVCMRDVRHSIHFFLYLNKARIQKAGQYPSPKEIGVTAQVRLANPFANLPKTWGRYLQQGVLSSRRLFARCIQQIRPAAGNLLQSKPTRLFDDIRTKWASRPPFLATGILFTLIVAFMCVLTLYQQAKREAEFRQQIQDVIQHANDHSTASQTAKSRIDKLERRLDDKFDVLSKNLDTVRQSITQNDALVAVVNSRLDNSSDAAKSDPPPGVQLPAAAQPDQKSDAGAPIRQDSAEQDPVAATNADQQPANPPFAAIMQVDQQPGKRLADVLPQIDQRPAIQQAVASTPAVDPPPANQMADASADAKQKPEKTQQSVAQVSDVNTAPAKPDSHHDTVGAASKTTTPVNGTVPHLGIGVVPLTSGLAETTGSAGKHGLVITVVDPGSPAEKAGVQTHDLLLKIDGTAVSKPEQVRQALLSLKGKHALFLTLKRGGKIEHLKLKVG
jgi:membrane-associated protease RseP (regulator of RpoE activity)